MVKKTWTSNIYHIIRFMWRSLSFGRYSRWQLLFRQGRGLQYAVSSSQSRIFTRPFPFEIQPWRNWFPLWWRIPVFIEKRGDSRWCSMHCLPSKYGYLSNNVSRQIILSIRLEKTVLGFADFRKTWPYEIRISMYRWRPGLYWKIKGKWKWKTVSSNTHCLRYFALSTI